MVLAKINVFFAIVTSLLQFTIVVVFILVQSCKLVVVVSLVEVASGMIVVLGSSFDV